MFIVYGDQGDGDPAHGGFIAFNTKHVRLYLYTYDSVFLELYGGRMRDSQKVMRSREAQPSVDRAKP